MYSKLLVGIIVSLFALTSFADPTTVTGSRILIKFIKTMQPETASLVCSTTTNAYTGTIRSLDAVTFNTNTLQLVFTTTLRTVTDGVVSATSTTTITTNSVP